MAAARRLAELVGLGLLLFLARFVARGYLVPQMDQECHIGGIAIDLLAHGVRFPLLAYAPNEYDNGSFFSGVLTAVSFALLGRNVLALKLVTHVIATAGAVAMLSLLRGCLQEVGLNNRRARWTATAALVVALVLAPTVVTALSMYAVGNHTEGSAIDVMLLAVFARRVRKRSAAYTAAFWALVGFALYLNKGTVLIIPVLAVAEMALAWPAWGPLVSAAGGFVLGVLPELLVISQRHGMGWLAVASKGERAAHAFPWAFFDAVFTLAEYRIELLAAWGLAIATGIALLIRTWRRARSLRADWCTDPAAAPVTLALVLGVTLLHLVALAVMTQGGFDAYAIYGYPTLVVLFALMLAALCAYAGERWSESAATWGGVAALGLTVVLYRPSALTWSLSTVSELWRDRAGAACSWRFAEGFEREHQYGLAPRDRTREQHAIVRCRSLSENAQVLDCIGGIARELTWRRGGRIEGEPPAGLDESERHAYAYYYGTHRKGDTTPCQDFTDPSLSATCVAAAQLECLFFADQYAHLFGAQRLAPPRCDVAAPPMDGYWAQRRLDLLSRSAGVSLNLASGGGEGEMRACKPVFDLCY